MREPAVASPGPRGLGTTAAIRGVPSGGETGIRCRDFAVLWSLLGRKVNTDDKILCAVGSSPKAAVSGAKELVVTPTYHVFRHLSFFLDPEADVLDTTASGPDEELSALGFKNPDGSTVAVVYAANAGNVTVSMAGQMLSADLPGQGFATFYVEP